MAARAHLLLLPSSRWSAWERGSVAKHELIEIVRTTNVESRGCRQIEDPRVCFLGQRMSVPRAVVVGGRVTCQMAAERL